MKIENVLCYNYIVKCLIIVMTPVNSNSNKPLYDRRDAMRIGLGAFVVMAAKFTDGFVSPSSTDILTQPCNDKHCEHLHSAHIVPKRANKVNQKSPIMNLINDPTFNEVVFGSLLAAVEIIRLIELNFEKYQKKEAPFDVKEAEQALKWNNANLAAMMVATPIVLTLASALKPIFKNIASGNEKEVVNNKAATMGAFHMQSFNTCFLYPALSDYFRDEVILPNMNKAKANPFAHPLPSPTQILRGLANFATKKIPELIKGAKNSAELRALNDSKTALEASVAYLSFVMGIALPGDQTDSARLIGMLPRQALRTRVFLERASPEELPKQLPVQTGLTITWPEWYGLLVLWNKLVDPRLGKADQYKELRSMLAATMLFLTIKTSSQKTIMKRVQAMLKNSELEDTELRADIERSVSEGDFSWISRYIGKPTKFLMDKIDDNSVFDKLAAIFLGPISGPVAKYLMPKTFEEDIFLK